MEQKFLNFNKTQSHGHKSKQLSIQTLSLKIDKLRLHLDREYMNGTHMTLLRNILKGICDSLDKKQAIELSKNHQTAVLPKSKIEDFRIIKLKYHSYDDSVWEDRFLNLKNILSDTYFYVSVEINMHAFKDSGRRDLRHAIEILIKKDFLYWFPKSSIYYFKLPSQGPHKAIHILWKQFQIEDSTPQQMKLVEEIRNNSKSFYSRAMRKEIQHKLKRLGLVEAHQVVFVIKDLLGDDSANNSENQCAVLHRLYIVVSCGEDIIVDLRKNNGSKPKFEKFWEIRYFSFYFIIFYFYYYYYLSGEVAHQKQFCNSSTDFKLLRGCSALMRLLARNCYK